MSLINISRFGSNTIRADFDGLSCPLLANCGLITMSVLLFGFNAIEEALMGTIS